MISQIKLQNLYIKINQYDYYEEEKKEETEQERERRELAEAKKAYIAIRLDGNKVAKFVKLAKEKN